MAEATQTAGTRTGDSVTRYATVRADAALTASYVASNYMDVSWADKINVHIQYTYNSATSIEWYIEWSYDGTTFGRSINVSPSAGTNTVTANNQTYATSATINLCDGGIPVEGAFVHVYIKRTGGAATDTAAIVIEGIGTRGKR